MARKVAWLVERVRLLQSSDLFSSVQNRATKWRHLVDRLTLAPFVASRGVGWGGEGKGGGPWDASQQQHGRYTQVRRWLASLRRLSGDTPAPAPAGAEDR